MVSLQAPSFVFVDEIGAIAGRHARRDPRRRATFEALIAQLDGEYVFYCSLGSSLIFSQFFFMLERTVCKGWVQCFILRNANHVGILTAILGCSMWFFVGISYLDYFRYFIQFVAGVPWSNWSSAMYVYSKAYSSFFFGIRSSNVLLKKVGGTIRWQGILKEKKKKNLQKSPIPKNVWKKISLGSLF